MKYRHLNGKTEYYPFAARTRLRFKRNRRALLLFAAACLLFAAAALLAVRQGVFKGGQPSAPTESAELSAFPEARVEPGDETVRAPSDEREILPAYRRLYQKNPDLIGWLTVDGTSVSYPVMQTPGDNEHYLRLGFDGLYAPGGSLFLDERSSVTAPTDNLLIYGHNMADGSMFAELLRYKTPEFCTQHPTIRFDSLYQTGLWAVVAVLETRVDPAADHPYYTFFEAENEDDWQQYYDEICAAALYDTGVRAQYGDELLTLSTCGETYATNKRFAVVAKRVAE